MKRLLALAALLTLGAASAIASTDPVADTRQIMAGTVTTKSTKNAYLSGARDTTAAFQGALTAYKAVRAAEPKLTVACADGTVILAPGVCPVAAPIPTPAPFVGETPIADNFTPVTEPIAVPGTSGEWVGAFRMTCAAGQLLQDDPILLPGQTGASHLHQFWGNTGTNASSTYQSLRTTGSSTCGGPASNPINRTAYWMPAMLDGAGHAVKPDNIQIYYKQLPAGSDHCLAAAKACVGLPNGIRLVFGYNMKTGKGGPADITSDDQWHLHYECWADDKGTQTVTSSFRTIADAAKVCPAGQLLVIQFIVPGCWDGVNLDSADHRGHLTYGTPQTGGQVCPADHPYLITAWQGNVRFTTDVNFAAGKWHLSSDEMVPGAIAGSTLHLDYFEAWSPPIKAKWQKLCIDGHLSCSDGQLGDGTMIPTVSLPPPHQLVAL